MKLKISNSISKRLISIFITLMIIVSGINIEFNQKNSNYSLKINLKKSVYAVDFDPATDTLPIETGANNIAIILPNGDVKASGLNNYYQLCTGTTSYSTTFIILNGLNNVKQLAMGDNYFLALLKDGTVKAWGYNGYGQLGLGDTSNRTVPTIINGLTGVKQLSIVANSTFALMEDGTVKAWGQNGNGRLGLGDTSQRTVPTIINGLTGVKQLSIGNNSTFALMEDGIVKAWGYNGYGQLGLGDTSQRTVPNIINGMTGVKQLSIGDNCTFALMEDGTVKAWGQNGNGHLGLGDTSHRNVPTIINGLIGVKQLSIGNNSTFALMEDGTVKAWGYNAYYQLGLGDTSQRNVPTIINGLTGVKQLSIGTNNGLALIQDGTVKSWGYNTYGELGLGDTGIRTTPVIINELTGVLKLSTRINYSVAFMGDGTVKAWGYNGNGQLGLGNAANRFTPTQIPNLNYNTKPKVNVVMPTTGYTIYKLEESLSATINVSDAEYNILTCKYYLDSEYYPREEKIISANSTEQTLVFGSLDTSGLALGNHKLRFEVSDGIEASVIETNFTVNRTGTDISINNNNYGSATININDSSLSNTLYQIKCGSKYVNQNGRLSMDPEWVLLPNKSIIIEGLLSNLNYTFAAKAKNSVGGETNYGNSATLAAAPMNFRIDTVNDNKIRLAWDSVEGADGYILECDGILKESISDLWIEDTDLLPNSSHKYRVRAVNGNTMGQWSEYIEGNTKGLKPILPTNVEVDSGATTNTITWSSVDGAIGYEVEADGVVISTGTKLVYTHQGLKPNTLHSYRVRARNIAGTGPWSTLKEIMTTDGLPQTPSNIIFKASGDSITLNWDFAIDAESHEVAEVINGEEVNVVNTEEGTSYVRKGLVPGSTHVYKIRGLNSIGTGEWVTLQPITTYMLDTPENLKALSTDTAITLSWDKVKDSQYYEINIKTKGENGELVDVSRIDGITDLSHTINSLEPENRYIISIKAKNGSGESAITEPMTVMTLPVKPLIPTNVTAIITNTSITICWDAVPDVVGYDIELDGVVLENDNVTTYINNELIPFETHTYRVRARSNAIEGEWSTLQSIQTLPGKPLAPSFVFVKSSQTGATISWKAVEGAIGYDLEVYDGVKTEIIENIKETSYTHRRILLNAECEYRVRTRNVEGISSWSGYIINNAIKASLSKNKNVDIGLVAADVTDFSPYTMVVSYNPGVLDVMDLSNLTGEYELNPGKIENTDITIKEFTPGRIVFAVDKVMSPDEAWTGIVNSIKFKAKANGGTTITYTVQCKVKE